MSSASGGSSSRVTTLANGVSLMRTSGEMKWSGGNAKTLLPHSHQCVGCQQWYTHVHPVKREKPEHRAWRGECPNPSCSRYGSRSQDSTPVTPEKAKQVQEALLQSLTPDVVVGVVGRGASLGGGPSTSSADPPPSPSSLNGTAPPSLSESKERIRSLMQQLQKGLAELQPLVSQRPGGSAEALTSGDTWIGLTSEARRPTNLQRSTTLPGTERPESAAGECGTAKCVSRWESIASVAPARTEVWGMELVRYPDLPEGMDREDDLSMEFDRDIGDEIAVSRYYRGLSLGWDSRSAGEEDMDVSESASVGEAIPSATPGTSSLGLIESSGLLTPVLWFNDSQMGHYSQQAVIIPPSSTPTGSSEAVVQERVPGADINLLSPTDGAPELAEEADIYLLSSVEPALEVGEEADINLLSFNSPPVCDHNGVEVRVRSYDVYGNWPFPSDYERPKRPTSVPMADLQPKSAQAAAAEIAVEARDEVAEVLSQLEKCPTVPEAGQDVPPRFVEVLTRIEQEIVLERLRKFVYLKPRTEALRKELYEEAWRHFKDFGVEKGEPASRYAYRLVEEAFLMRVEEERLLRPRPPKPIAALPLNATGGPSTTQAIAAGARSDKPEKVVQLQPDTNGRKHKGKEYTIEVDSELVEVLRREAMFQPRCSTLLIRLKRAAWKHLEQYDLTGRPQSEWNLLVGRAVAAATDITVAEREARAHLKDPEEEAERLKSAALVQTGVVGHRPAPLFNRVLWWSTLGFLGRRLDTARLPESK
jgi:hypothetical protein